MDGHGSHTSTGFPWICKQNREQTLIKAISLSIKSGPETRQSWSDADEVEQNRQSSEQAAAENVKNTERLEMCAEGLALRQHSYRLPPQLSHLLILRLQTQGRNPGK